MSSTNESCTNLLGWNIVEASTGLSALSGVLAGFLIASAAVLFAPGGRCVPYTVALLASGVPGLILSSYIFSAISGLKATDATTCDQTWSQGLIAIALLLIGSAVLVCGFSWVLVTYSEDLEHILLNQFSRDGIKKTSIKEAEGFTEIVEKRSVLLISMNGWISASVIVATTIILIRANNLYIQASRYSSEGLRKALVYLVTAIGLYVVLRSVHTIIQRTQNALNRISSGPRHEHRVFREGSLLAGVMLSSVIPPWIAGYADPRVFVLSFLLITAIYFVNRMLDRPRWCSPESAEKKRVETQLHVSNSAPKSESCSSSPSKAADDVPDEVGEDAASAIVWSERLFQVGKLAETIYSVAFLSLAGLIFAGLVMEKPMIGGLRIVFSLTLGGLYPAVILLGLSRSVASHENDCAIPLWLTKPIWSWIP